MFREEQTSQNPDQRPGKPYNDRVTGVMPDNLAAPVP